MSSQHPRTRLMLTASLLVFALLLRVPVHAQDNSAEIVQKLSGFDAFMEKTLKDWNAPGIGVGIVQRQTRLRQRLWLSRIISTDYADYRD
jgi:hypothetical protein